MAERTHTSDVEVHAIYTLNTGESFRANGRCPSTTPFAFAYYNRLATRIIAERDGVRECVYAYDARNQHAVKLCVLGGNGEQLH